MELPTTPARDEWRQQWAHSQPDLARLSQTRRLPPSADASIMRSTQMDAARLDEELALLLREQFMRIFSLFQPAAVGRLLPELTAVLDFLIFRYSVWEGHPLPGMSLMNLRFRNENTADAAPNAGGHTGVEGPGLTSSQSTMYCLGTVLLRYLWGRGTNAAAVRHWGDASSGSWQALAWRGLRGAEASYRAASVVNFALFLRTGRYRSLLERCLGARLVYARPSASRAISYEYLNRQLVWSEVSEVLLFLLPLVDATAVQRAVRRILPRLPARLSRQPGGGGSSSGMVAQQGGSAFLAGEESCGICGAAEILTPFAAEPCRHAFCYFCLRGHTLADPQFQCPRCLERVEAMRPANAAR